MATELMSHRPTMTRYEKNTAEKSKAAGGARLAYVRKFQKILNGNFSFLDVLLKIKERELWLLIN